MEASPIITTSAPAAVAPSAKAPASAGRGLGRMSWPTTTAAGRRSPATNAAPVARASASSIWSPTRPRTSYALKMACEVLGAGGVLVVEHARKPSPPAEATAQSVVRTRRWPRRVPLRPSSGPCSSTAPRGARAGRAGPPRGRRRPARAGRRWSARASAGPGPGADLPAARGAETLAVRLAEVVGVRLGVRRQRAQHGGLVGVHVGQRVDRGTATRGTRTTTCWIHAGDATPRADRRPIRLAA